jgi:DNA-directed RNA polymerase specialized sigma24 family protein
VSCTTGNGAARVQANGSRMAKSAVSQNDHGEAILPDGPAADRRLVDRCLSGNVEAWRELFRQQHRRLLASIRGMFGPAVTDVNKAEEIAARVWCELLVADGRLLDQFDVAQGCRLSTFLATLAHSAAIAMFRADKRRRRREAIACRSEKEASQESQHDFTRRLTEFLNHLTPTEREFCRSVLLGGGNQDRSYTTTNDWQLRSRIQRKLAAFVETNDW